MAPQDFETILNVPDSLKRHLVDDERDDEDATSVVASKECSDHHPSSKKARLEGVNNDTENRNPCGNLCKTCATIDFGALHEMTLKEGEIYTVQNLGHFDWIWPRSGCVLCEFFAKVWSKIAVTEPTVWEEFGEASLGEASPTSVYVILYSTADLTKFSYLRDLKEDSFGKKPLCLSSYTAKGLGNGHRWALRLSHYQYTCSPFDEPIFFDSTERPNQCTLLARSVPPILTDFSVLQGWLEFCVKSHKDYCRLSKTNDIPGFHLFDCGARHVVRAESTYKYVALSYVWGTEDCQMNGSLPLPSNLPQTINDAIFVTSKLGFQFLWIDRYCILAEDQTSRHLQISMMDVIYEAAELTIIAADGINVNSGLTGISKARDGQPRLSMGPWQLNSIMPDPSIAIKRSKYFTRAWTYQEGLLSRRRLFFSRDQAYFECHSCSFQESLAEPEALVKVQSESIEFEKPETYSMGTGSKFRVFPSTFLHQIQIHPWLLSRCFSEYTGRELSYQADALNGLLGLLRRLRHPYFNVAHVLGVPILWSLPNWSLNEGFAAGLCWELSPGGSDRRSLFPSWSWAGWYSGVMPRSQVYYSGLRCPSELQFSFEAEDGRDLTWDDLHSNDGECISNGSYLPLYLHIHSWSISCRLRRDEFYYDQSSKWIAEIQNHLGTHQAECQIDKKLEDEKIKAQTWDAVLLGGREEPYANLPDYLSGDPKRPFLMVLEDMGEWFERIGTIDLSRDGSSRHYPWDYRVPFEVGTDLSHYLAGAKLREFKLG